MSVSLGLRQVRLFWITRPAEEKCLSEAALHFCVTRIKETNLAIRGKSFPCWRRQTRMSDFCRLNFLPPILIHFVRRDHRHRTCFRWTVKIFEVATSAGLPQSAFLCNFYPPWTYYWGYPRINPPICSSAQGCSTVWNKGEMIIQEVKPALLQCLLLPRMESKTSL